MDIIDRYKNGERDFKGIYLRDANLLGADLEGVDLEGAYLENAFLRKAYLTDAYLEGANLKGANLEGADLTGADLTDANLEGANLTDANLTDANLEGANLTDANLTDANLEGADLTGVNLEGANLTDANLTDADLTGANLEGANLTDANLTDANLEGADLTGANLEGADLFCADLTFLLKINTLGCTPNPNQICYLAMHQCYSATPVFNCELPTEQKSGEIIIKRLLAGQRGHFGILEHPQINLNVINFPHSLMQQIRTHRVGISFAVQSFRYTSESIIKVANGKMPVESAFYFRPVWHYTDREGKRYEYTEKELASDRVYCLKACEEYKKRINSGFSEEHARDCIPFNVRQHFVMSCNARSLMHLLDLRWKADAQLEAQIFSELLFGQFKDWMPQVANWYLDNRAKKARLSP